MHHCPLFFPFKLEAPLTQNNILKHSGDAHLWFFISHGHSFGASLRCHTKNTSARTYSCTFKLFFRTCAVMCQCASTSHGAEWLTSSHEGESAVWTWAGPRGLVPRARYRHIQAHVHAHSVVFSFVWRITHTEIPQCAVHCPADLLSALRSTVSVFIQNSIHTGILKKYELFLFFNLTQYIPVAILHVSINEIIS